MRKADMNPSPIAANRGGVMILDKLRIGDTAGANILLRIGR